MFYNLGDTFIFIGGIFLIVFSIILYIRYIVYILTRTLFNRISLGFESVVLIFISTIFSIGVFSILFINNFIF